MFQSIAEFLDGMPSFDKRNFSQFHSDNGRSKRVPVYISTDDTPADQSLELHCLTYYNYFLF